MMFKGTELNYPVHEKELLAVVWALKKWRVDLLGSSFFIYTDHKTLKNFTSQKDLLHHQACWMELMSQFDAKIVYIKGEDNCMADALSRLPDNTVSSSVEQKMQHPYTFCEDDNAECMITSIALPTNYGPWESVKVLSASMLLLPTVNTTLKITADKTFLEAVKAGYADNEWCKTLPNATMSWPGLVLHDGLWYVGDCLIIPWTKNLCETLFTLAHNVLGHYGFDKMYGSCRNAYYWLNMHQDLKCGYVASCPDCQWNKSTTNKPYGPLHLLPIPDQQGDSVTINFIGPLLEDEGKNCIITFMDRLGSNIQLVPTQTDITAEDLAYLVFNKWYCKNRLLADIVSDRDKLFMSQFWKALHKLTGVKLKLSTVYHPETDSASKHTNKTVNQALHYHVERNQLGWVHALLCVHFDMMNTVNKSTSFTPFQLCFG